MPKFKVRYKVCFWIKHEVEADSYQDAEEKAWCEGFLRALRTEHLDVEIDDLEELPDEV